MGANRNNSAGRLHKIFHDAWHKPDKKKIIDAWSDVLGVEDSDKHSRTFFITDALSIIRGELDFIERKMAELGIADDLFRPYINRCKNALNISNLEGPWASPKAQIREDTLLSLLFCAELMEDDESEVAVDELQEILQMVQALRERLNESGMSNDVRLKMEKHLDLISASVQKAPLVGTRALRDGFRAGANEIVEDEQTIIENAQVEEVSGIINLWGHIRRAGGAVVEADKITNATLSLLQRGGGALKMIGWDG